LNEPSSATMVWATVSALPHTTVWPTLTVIELGEKARSAIITP